MLRVMAGILSYEFNLFEITRTKIRAREMLPAGKAKIEVARRQDRRACPDEGYAVKKGPTLACPR